MEKEEKPINYAQVFAIQAKNEKRILQICPTMPRKSGIYMFYRINEKNEKCIYIGQAKCLLERCGKHLNGRETHIDKSLYLHKLYSATNPHGWKVCVAEICTIAELDKKEQKYIEHYKNRDDVVLYNVCGGGQFDKKQDIGQRHQPNLKRYKSGKQYGYEKARKEIKHLFDLHLDYSIRGKETVNKRKAYDKFTQFLGGDQSETESQIGREGENDE